MSLDNKDIITTAYSLGGIGDTVGSLYGESNLMMDMLDNPTGVKNVMEQIKNIWINEFNKICNNLNI